MKPIDKDKVVKEIKRRIKEISQMDKGSYEIGLYDAYKIILSFLDTLEVKEVDLKKEVREYIIKNGTSLEEPDEFLTTLMQLDDMVMFAKHFYELGLNVKKG